MRCSAKLVDIEASDIECELSDHDSEVKYFVKPAGPSNKTFEIEMKFSKKQDCEADERLTEGLLGLVEVQPVEKAIRNLQSNSHLWPAGWWLRLLIQ